MRGPIQAWVTNDGKYFTTLDQAEKHERLLKFLNHVGLFRRNTVHELDVKAVATWIFERYDVTLKLDPPKI